MAGVVLSIAAIGASACAAIAGAIAIAPTAPNGTSQVNVVQTVLFLVVAALLQAGAGLAFNRTGRADPSLARSAVRHLFQLVNRAAHARTLAEKHYESGTPADAKKAMGIISVELSFLEEGFATAAQDWAEFHPEAFRSIQEENQ